jgi:hypothetical protein
MSDLYQSIVDLLDQCVEPETIADYLSVPVGLVLDALDMYLIVEV